MNWRLLFGKVRQKLAREGITGVIAGVRRAMTSGRPADDFDQRHGVDTGGIAQLWNFTVQAASKESESTGGFYQPVDEPTFRESMSFLEGREGDFTLVDIGTGKGRPLIMGAWLGFRRVIGVEFAVELADVARRNIAKLGIANAEVVTMDASVYQFPDENQVVFLSGATLGAAMTGQLLDNLARVALIHEIHVVYIRPYHGHVLDSHPAMAASNTSANGLIRRWRVHSPNGAG